MFPSFDHCSCAGEQKECALKLCCSARQGNAVAVKVEANVFKVILSIQGLDKLEARLKHACVFLKTPGISCTIYSCTFGALSCFWLQLSYGLSEWEKSHGVFLPVETCNLPEPALCAPLTYLTITVLPDYLILHSTVFLKKMSWRCLTSHKGCWHVSLWDSVLTWLWLPQLYFEELEMYPISPFILHLKKSGPLHTQEYSLRAQVSLSAWVALPEHAEAYGRNRSVLHSVFQNSTYLGRIMPAAKNKRKNNGTVENRGGLYCWETH